MFKDALTLFVGYLIVVFFVRWHIISFLYKDGGSLETPIVHMSGAEVLSYEDTFDRNLLQFELKYDENDSPTLIIHYGDKGTFPERSAPPTERLNIHNHFGRSRIPLPRELQFLDDNDDPIKNRH